MRKYIVLYNENLKGYLEKDANCLSAKEYKEPKIIFSI